MLFRSGLPLFSQSAVDGYAICSTSDLLASNQFKLVGEIRAGQTASIRLEEGQAIRIFTGGEIPQGTTTVARQEIIQVISSDQIALTHDLKLQADIRYQGEEIQKGQCLATQGQHLTVGAIAASSMVGVKDVGVYAQPKIAVLITGDEVASSIEDFKAGKIFDANGPMLKAWFQNEHFDIELIHVIDDREQLKNKIKALSEIYDVIFTTGGVSVGDYDFIRPVSLELGFKEIFWKIKQKPGKPMFFAQLNREEHSTCYLLGLPGNPAAVYVGMQIYGKVLLNALQGKKALPDWFTGVVTHDLKPDQRERFLRMSAQFIDGQLKLTSLKKQQSHMLSNLMDANCLVRIPANKTIVAGEYLQGIFIQ